MISGKAAEYKLFSMGNEKDLGRKRIFLAKKWIDKVNDGMNLIKVLVQGVIISVYSVYAPHCV